MLDEAARWDDLVVGLRPMSNGAKGVLACCLVSVGPATTAKASSEGWRLRLRPNNHIWYPGRLGYAFMKASTEAGSLGGSKLNLKGIGWKTDGTS
jgi:hypothetical protein